MHRIILGIIFLIATVDYVYSLFLLKHQYPWNEAIAMPFFILVFLNLMNRAEWLDHISLFSPKK